MRLVEGLCGSSPEGFVESTSKETVSLRRIFWTIERFLGGLDSMENTDIF